jgi:hypothetical protein
LFVINGKEHYKACLSFLREMTPNKTDKFVYVEKTDVPEQDLARWAKFMERCGLEYTAKYEFTWDTPWLEVWIRCCFLRFPCEEPMYVLEVCNSKEENPFECLIKHKGGVSNPNHHVVWYGKGKVDAASIEAGIVRMKESGPVRSNQFLPWTKEWAEKCLKEADHSAASTYDEYLAACMKAKIGGNH